MWFTFGRVGDGCSQSLGRGERTAQDVCELHSYLGEAAMVCGSLQVWRSERAACWQGVFERERDKGGETVSREYVIKADIILILKKLKLFV